MWDNNSKCYNYAYEYGFCGNHEGYASEYDLEKIKSIY